MPVAASGSEVDHTDIALSLLLMSNSRMPYSDIADKMGLSINAVHRRIGAMVDSGIIRAFTARPSLVHLQAVPVWIFGRSEAAHPEDVHLHLKNSDSTYWVADSGGGFIYAGGYLKSISDLDSYVAFTRKEAEMGEPTVGILWQPTNRFPGEKLQPLDYQILASLHKDSRKSVTEVACEVNASAKTVHRRLERMIEKGLADLSIDWYPDASNDIVSICHISLARSADRTEVLSRLKQSFPQNVLVDVIFSNLPSQFALFLWANSMKEMHSIRDGISKADGVGSVALNVLQIGYMFDTWRDKLLPDA